MTTIALIGDRRPSVRSHVRLEQLFAPEASVAARGIRATWLSSDAVDLESLAEVDGIWVLPGSPYADRDRVLGAITYARVHDVPFLGSCGGLQHLLLEFARSVAGLTSAEHAEEHPEAAHPIIVPLTCSLVDEDTEVIVEPSTIAADLLGAGRHQVSYVCSYGLDQRATAALVAAGLRIAARDAAGEVRMAEVASCRFMVGSLFQPELMSTPDALHPLIEGFFVAAGATSAQALVGRGPVDS